MSQPKDMDVPHSYTYMYSKKSLPPNKMHWDGPYYSSIIHTICILF